MAHREEYSGFKYFQALPPQDLDSTATNGADVDTLGYNAVTFVLNVGGFTSAGAMSADNEHTFALQHADVSTAGGAGTYADVPSQYVVMSGANTVTSGQFLSIGSYTFASAAYAVGYIGQKRYVRIKASGAGAPSVMSAGALAILGWPEDWPVNKVGA